MDIFGIFSYFCKATGVVCRTSQMNDDEWRPEVYLRVATQQYSWDCHQTAGRRIFDLLKNPLLKNFNVRSFPQQVKRILYLLTQSITICYASFCFSP